MGEPGTLATVRTGGTGGREAIPFTDLFAGQKIRCRAVLEIVSGVGSI
jgi:hypothetical protein